MQFPGNTPAPATEARQPDRLLALPDVEQVTGLKKTTIYGLIKKGEFPRPIRLTRRASRWPASQVQAWIADCIQAKAA